MANHRKTETTAKLKKVYSSIENACRLSEINNTLGFPNEYYNFEEFFKSSLAPYINYSEVNQDEYKNIYYTEKNINKLGWNNSGSGEYFVSLNDGTTLMFYDNGCPYVFTSVLVDINGLKKPNEAGRDIFVFYIHDKDSAYIPVNEREDFNNLPIFGFYYTLPGYRMSRNSIIESCIDNDSVESVHFCTYLIMNDGWEIKDDYPIKI